MPRLRIAEPLWLARRAAGERRACPRLTHDLETDVAIVGGGMTGVSVAYRFARAGVTVTLLEAGRIGAGSTAASTALLMQEPDADFAELARRYGARAARRVWRLSLHATRDLIATLEAERFDCALERRDSIYYALRAPAARRLRREFVRRRAARLAGRWLDARALIAETGIRGAAAIRTHGNAQVDPYRACLGLAAAARRAGARVFERSRVDRIDAHASGVRLTVNGATVRARRVVVATGYATPFLEPLRAPFRMLHTYVVATRPLAAALRREVGLDGVMLWDTARPYHYARWTSDGRLLFGGADRPLLQERQRARALQQRAHRLWRYFERLRPALEGAEIDFAWEGLFATTRDGLPYIGPHERYPHHLFALGYGGNGMTFGFLAATLLLDWYRGRRTRDLRLFAFDRDVTRGGR